MFGERERERERERACSGRERERERINLRNSAETLFFGFFPSLKDSHYPIIGFLYQKV